MKVYKILIAFSTIICVLLSMDFVSYADVTTDTVNNATKDNSEIILNVTDQATLIGTSPEVTTEEIIEDNICNIELSDETKEAIENGASNNSTIEIIDEDVPLSVTIVDNNNDKNAVPLDETPKTGDNISIYLMLSVISFIILAYTILEIKNLYAK